MFKRSLKVPTYMNREGAEELERLGIDTKDFLGEIEDIYVWNIVECFENEVEGTECTTYSTGSSGLLISPLRVKDFVKMVDDHIEKYGNKKQL